MLLTPGPTEVPDRVREAMAREPINPDVDPAFVELYESVCEKLARVYGADESGATATDHDVVVLGGEGILGLEAAVESVVAPGDDVLCVANGVYGEGFADFVSGVGGNPVVAAVDHDDPLPVEEVADLLASDDYDFEVATLVHCETPTGVLNDLDPILDLLDEHDVLSIVDAVSSLGGTPVPTDRIDLCLGASQKCLSSPAGLTTVAVSDRAWDRIEAVDPDSYYTNLLPWRSVVEDEWFPYTHLVSNVYGLDESLDVVLEEGVESVFARHADAAAHCRARGAELGLSVVPGEDSRSSPTVTAFEVPGRADELQTRLAEEHDVTLATGLGDGADDVLRVGHMGYGAEVEKVDRAMDALEAVL
ncbi:pyridoxal-phosphate-dependent aminotransferase family protein [Salinirubrum litoreum]|uniref:Pyridoxal-phosphate-dependent aminotransferase family protein n=1 Tax=Salinirubrum litoreum TaxID=1126234 RepID=A0ABD5R9B8_9EURY|nr:alanine--glyoxylate aminotransferase family protein [Salinirubrum litoreum]